jgi:signal transduction histidine kinase
MIDRLTPQHAFGLAGVVAVASVMLCLWLILQAPWFGIRIDPTPEGVGRLVFVDETAREAGLRVGDRVRAFATPGHEPEPLQPLSLISDPDRTGSFPALRELFAHVGALYAATREPHTEVVLDDGRTVILERRGRPFGSLPPGWWVMAGGVVPFLVGAGVWSYRRGDTASRLLLLAGASFMGIALSNLVYAYRQPSIDPLVFGLAVYTNRLSTLLFFFSYMAVFWVYPRRLGSTRAITAGLVVVLLLFANELTHALHWPGDPFAFPVVLSIPVTLGLIAVQWRLSSRNPVDRAALQWFVLAMMTGMVLVTGLYFLPGLLGAPPMLSLEAAFAIGTVSYLGLIMAVVRYRLFQLGEWWLTAWMWLLGGTAVVVLDVAIAYLLNVAPAYVIALSIIIVGWVYFPLRQWLWRRLFWHGDGPMDWVPRALLQTVVTARGEAALTEHWHALLRRLFRPLDMNAVTGELRAAAIRDEGLTLVVPNLSGPGGVMLSYRSSGRRLFGPADVALVTSLLHMAGPAADAQRARQAATRRERERIMRDLHDDVGARLLTLSHRLRDPRDTEMVRGAMQALRETIYSLNRPEGVELGTALADWRVELVERLDSSDIALDWQVDETLGGINLSAAQRSHLGQVLREAVSNAVRHGRPTRLSVAIRRLADALRVEIGDDGGRGDPSAWTPGTGLMNMRRRMHELGGTIHWTPGPDGCCVRLELPLVTAQAVAGGQLH